MATATVLSIIQSVSEEMNLGTPVFAKGSTDAGVLQMRRLLDKVGKDIRRRSDWQILSRRVEWTSIAGEDQGDIDTLCPENREHIIPNTFWDNTERKQVFGPVSDKDWQALKALVPSSPFYQFRIAANRLLISGPMLANHTLALVYKSRNWLQVGGTNPAQYTDSVDEDGDIPLFREELMVLGLMAFWRKAKEMEFQEEMTKYELACVDDASVDDVKPIIRMDGDGGPIVKPGIWVPSGNWNV